MSLETKKAAKESKFVKVTITRVKTAKLGIDTASILIGGSDIAPALNYEFIHRLRRDQCGRVLSDFSIK